MSFEHQKDDVVVTVRFRRDVWDFVDAKMHNQKFNPFKKYRLGKKEAKIEWLD